MTTGQSFATFTDIKTPNDRLNAFALCVTLVTDFDQDSLSVTPPKQNQNYKNQLFGHTHITSRILQKKNQKKL